MIRSDDFICPDWRSLAEDRDRDADGEARWRLGLEHAAGCSSCREEIVAIDPLAVFSLAPLDAAHEASRQEVALDEAAEVEAMLQAVAVVRRHQVDRERPPVRWLPWAAGALLCLSLAWFALPQEASEEGDATMSEVGTVLDTALDTVLTEAEGQRSPESAAMVPVSDREQTLSEPVGLGVVTVGAALASTQGEAGAESVDPRAMERAALEALTPPAAAPRVYRWQDRDLSIVMIVDETLDV